MDRAEQSARAIVDQFRSLFRADAEHMADGLVNAIAGELRAATGRVRSDAVAAAELALADIRQISKSTL
ncbi:MAG TPA: hypothetical protein VD860_02900 [Azospirillum sp.]|nr:hypothetical protein [Azospirillum sp.]